MIGGHRQLAIAPGVARDFQRQTFGRVGGDPCAGCPLEKNVKVLSVLPSRRRLVVVGLGPWADEEQAGFPFAGKGGQMLRSALTSAGLERETEVGFANLGRCRPSGGFESKEWAVAEDRCWHHLQRDLSGWTGPLLLLGSRPLQRFLGDKKASVRRRRGLWIRLLDGRDVFSALHPAGILREREAKRRELLQIQFQTDLRRMADRVLGREQFPVVKFLTYRDPYQARPAIVTLIRRKDPWFFDIETYDAKGSPSRPGVATNPFHPDFRVRGVAVAISPSEGFWIDLVSWEDRKDEATALLNPAFMSDAEKGAFVSGFDSTGLIVQGWVTEVRNLARDPWLAAIALDTRGGGHSLERLVVDVLGEPQPKAGVDRSRIVEMSLERVADYAVKDACCEFRLDQVLRDWLERGDYL